MSSEVLSQQIQNQMSRQDPFTQARMQVQANDGQAQMVGDPFSQGMAPQQPAMPESAGGVQMAGMPSTTQMNGLGPQQTMDAKLMETLKKLDIDNKGIGINPLGKHLLMGRLEKRWGSDYAKRPDVSSALGEFDKTLSFYSDESAKSMNEAINKTNRTLSALKG